MLTLFTCPKPFVDPHIRQIQYNAIGSWMSLQPRPEILLLGNEQGVAEAAAEFGLRHLPELDTNEFGTPLVDSIFSLGEREAACPLLCYINADIILLSNFMKAVRVVSASRKKFLMVGRRWDMDFTAALDYSMPQWQEDFLSVLAERGVLHPGTGMDYFLFHRNFWGKIPPFALGRTIWDNWLLFRARQRHAVLIDATQVVTAVHQNHDYSHIPDGKKAAWEGAEATQNRKLANKGKFNLLNANWLLTPHGLVRACTSGHRRQAWESWPILHPVCSLPYRLIRKTYSLVKVRGSFFHK